VGALRTSEEGEDVVGGEARAVKSDDARPIDAPGRIIIDSAPIVATPRPAHSSAPRPRPLPAAPQRAGGLGLVVIVYIVAIAALGAAIYERFFMA
jgi:hypothetical protein